MKIVVHWHWVNLVEFIDLFNIFNTKILPTHFILLHILICTYFINHYYKCREGAKLRIIFSSIEIQYESKSIIIHNTN
jgi:hypothetical protein